MHTSNIGISIGLASANIARATSDMVVNIELVVL